MILIKKPLRNKNSRQKSVKNLYRGGGWPMGPEKIFLIVVIGLCVVGAILSSVTNKKNKDNNKWLYKRAKLKSEIRGGCEHAHILPLLYIMKEKHRLSWCFWWSSGEELSAGRMLIPLRLPDRPDKGAPNNTKSAGTSNVPAPEYGWRPGGALCFLPRATCDRPVPDAGGHVLERKAKKRCPK